MKSHQYASKRRLTNICCFIVSLGFIKLIFGAYVMAGGELFEFATEKQKPSPRVIVMEREQEQKLMNELAQKTLGTSQNILVAQNVSVNEINGTSEINGTHISNGMNAINGIKGEMKNIVLVSNSRVSFLPKSQKNDIAPVGNTKAQNASVNQTVKPVTKSFSEQVASNQSVSNEITTGTNLQDENNVMLVAEKISPKTLPTQANSKAFTSEVSNLERSDRISSDAVLARASLVTANIARTQVRTQLLKNAFGQDSKPKLDFLKGIENQGSNYISKNSQVQNQESQVKNQEFQKPQKSQKPSFFSLVGTAHAAEEVYIRPDENTNIPIPAPKVSPYSSPDSLEYKQSELNRKEEELIALQQQMNARMEELSALEGRIGGMVKDANALQSEKLKHLTATYTSMKAKKAAQALTSLEEELAVRILNGMKSKQSGEIFSYMDPIQAARLSKAMAELQM